MDNFKQHPIYQNYLVDKEGNVYSLLKKRIIKPYTTKNGYLQLVITYNGKKIRRFIHRLVLETYDRLGERSEETDHIDRNRKNNKIDNLRWVSKIDNLLNRECYGKVNLKGVSITKNKYTKKNGDIVVNYYYQSQITIDGVNIKIGTFKCKYEAHEAYKKAFLLYRGYEYKK